MVHGKSTNPYKEGGELRQKRLALQNSGNISKSKSAQINQLKTMESQRRVPKRARRSPGRRRRPRVKQRSRLRRRARDRSPTNSPRSLALRSEYIHSR